MRHHRGYADARDVTPIIKFDLMISAALAAGLFTCHRVLHVAGHRVVHVR